MDDHICDDAKSLDSFCSFTQEGSGVSGSRRDAGDQLSEDPMEDNEINVASTPPVKQSLAFHRASSAPAGLRFDIEEADDLDSDPLGKYLAASARASTAQILFAQELADCKKGGESLVLHRASSAPTGLRFDIEEGDDLDSDPLGKYLAASARASTEDDNMGPSIQSGKSGSDEKEDDDIDEDPLKKYLTASARASAAVRLFDEELDNNKKRKTSSNRHDGCTPSTIARMCSKEYHSNKQEGNDDYEDLDADPLELYLVASARASTAQKLFDQELADYTKAKRRMSRKEDDEDKKPSMIARKQSTNNLDAPISSVAKMSKPKRFRPFHQRLQKLDPPGSLLLWIGLFFLFVSIPITFLLMKFKPWVTD